MHSLETLARLNTTHVYAAMRDALAENSEAGYRRARDIAKAHPDLFMQNGQHRTHGDVEFDQGGEA